MSANYSDYRNMDHDFLKISVLFVNLYIYNLIQDIFPQMNAYQYMPNTLFECLSNVDLKMN
jgi:hypothetical protein